MVEFSLWDILRNLLLAARWTVSLSLIAFIGGGLVGLVLLVLRLSRLRGVDRAVGAYVQVFQGTPLLMQLFLAYFGIALFGIKTSPWTAAAVALTLYTSAYLTEIWRGCVASIPKGQWEAAQSLALSFYEQLRHVVLPQLLPFLAAAGRSGLALIWKIVLVVELLGRSNGVGFQIHLYFQLFDVAAIVGYALAFVCVMLLIEFLVVQPLETHANRWRPGAQARAA